MHVWCPWISEEDIGFPRTGVKVDMSQHVGAGKQSQILCKSSKCYWATSLVQTEQILKLIKNRIEVNWVWTSHWWAYFSQGLQRLSYISNTYYCSEVWTLSNFFLLGSCSLLFLEFYYKVFRYGFSLHYSASFIGLLKNSVFHQLQKVLCFNCFKHSFFLIHFIIIAHLVHKVTGITINVFVQLCHGPWLCSHPIVFFCPHASSC